MAKKKPIYSVIFVGKLGICHQAVKADDPEEAERKFLKRNPKLNKEDHIIGDTLLLEPAHKHYRILSSHAI